MKTNRSSIIKIAVILIGLSVMYTWITVSQEENRRKSICEYRKSGDHSYVDKFWKVIRESTALSKSHKDSFTKIYPTIVDNEYELSKDSTLYKWLVERIEDYDTVIYEKIDKKIRALRKECQEENDYILDLVEEHNRLIDRFPSSLVVGDLSKINDIRVEEFK